MMNQKGEEHYRTFNFCPFCEKDSFDASFAHNSQCEHKVFDHCHLTSIFRGPAHQKYNINLPQKRSNFIPFALHSFTN